MRFGGDLTPLHRPLTINMTLDGYLDSLDLARKTHTAEISRRKIDTQKSWALDFLKYIYIYPFNPRLPNTLGFGDMTPKNPTPKTKPEQKYPED